MKPQQVTNLILLVAVAITFYFIGSSEDEQLASDVNQKPIVLFNMSEEERDYNLEVDAVSNDTIFVSPKEIK